MTTTMKTTKRNVTEMMTCTTTMTEPNFLTKGKSRENQIIRRRIHKRVIKSKNQCGSLGSSGKKEAKILPTKN